MIPIPPPPLPPSSSSSPSLPTIYRITLSNGNIYEGVRGVCVYMFVCIMWRVRSPVLLPPLSSSSSFSFTLSQLIPCRVCTSIYEPYIQRLHCIYGCGSSSATGRTYICVYRIRVPCTVRARCVYMNYKSTHDDDNDDIQV